MKVSDELLEILVRVARKRKYEMAGLVLVDFDENYVDDVYLAIINNYDGQRRRDLIDELRRVDFDEVADEIYAELELTADEEIAKENDGGVEE